MEFTLHILFFVLINLAIIVLGYFFVKYKKILSSWIIFIASIVLICLIFMHENPVVKMLSIIATAFSGMKVIVASECYKERKLALKFGQWMVFATAWAGMRPQPFENLGNAPMPGNWAMIRFGFSRICAGLLLIMIAHALVLLPHHHLLMYVSVSIILLISLSLILHFGLLTIGAGIWRLFGVNTYLLFKAPANATSLTEFWSKRWNIAFSEMTSITIFRPLANRTGAATALMASFIFSGLLHELALSVPVNSGYGLPLLYFILQGCLVLIEKLLVARNIRFLRHKIVARLWTFFWVITPAPLLFHSQFLKQIVWPLAGLHV